ncbi:DNA-processing protein DprA [Bacillus toyonensis]|uniref:DNA-processing protein DprA n=1 Tax=Bacillus toyonensis TaxID=155322 RepID=UPI0018CDF6ED|nr:DNA-processing protein DprA [Bacillus toyonensis]MBG9608817.1 DNA polymerase III subunit beta [Bacillus toyonensis]MBG9845778.1 DNA polymerase III subunit beta [Bacillus toyonensis]MBG9850587.1 DNA polymerase III subunit beta [Bacillus toyonensis]MBG9874166.1 DNA polymerase III subunit beta [Bacillus toyonensis]MBG9891638.1 DNA polymerase III subunit beta [Bacillus toyonensis]
MSVKEMIFVLYDLGLSLATLSKLYRESNEEQLNHLLEGDFLELQFSLGVFDDHELELLSSIDSIQKSKSNISRLLAEFSDKEIEYFIYYEKDYPASLKNIPSPPFFIFMKGNRSLLENKFICSIVGTRNPTDQTLKQIDSTVQEMVSADIVITSGLALGTDIHAHKCTLNNNGKAVAVLPSPIDNVTPKGHKPYANEILAKDGLLISEYYKSETVFKKTNYIHRNRIISGLSNAVIIAECSEKSGTMHTARYAYKQKRPLYCFDNQSTGVLKILSSNSARIYTNLNDLTF